MEADIYEQYFKLLEKEQINDRLSGNLQSKMLIILPDPCENLGLIEKILGAINIKSIDEVATLKLQRMDGVSLYPVLKSQDIDKVISFGFDGAALGLHVDYKPYQITLFKGRSFIFTAALDTLSASSDHKKALWTSLKAWL